MHFCAQDEGRVFYRDQWLICRCYSCFDCIFLLGACFLLGIRSLLVAVLAFSAAAYAACQVQAAPVPAEMRSTAYTVTVNGRHVDVAHAAASYEFVSFDATGPVNVAITAAEPGFWDHGVDIQPWRLGLRPTRRGQTIRFRLRIAGQALHLASRRLSEPRPHAFCFCRLAAAASAARGRRFTSGSRAFTTRA